MPQEKKITPSRKRQPDDPEQSARFVEAARVAEVDESGKLFKKALDRVVPKRRKYLK
jgi:hypothetical protein